VNKVFAMLFEQKIKIKLFKTLIYKGK